MLETLQELDVYLLQVFNNWGRASVDPFWLFVTKIYVWIPILLPIIYLSVRKKTVKFQRIIFIGLVILLLFILSTTELTKVLIARIRPCNDEFFNGLFRELIHPDSYSFYSGHTATSVGITVYCISLLRKQFKWIWLLLIWALIFSYSRLYLAAHYPSDILVGAIMGFVFARLAVYIIKKKQLLK